MSEQRITPQQLRDLAGMKWFGLDEATDSLRQAADEIERLDAKNAALSEMHLACCASLKDAKDQEDFWKEQNVFVWEYVHALRKDMRRIAGMAGNPDAAQGCRDILKTVKESGVE